MRKTVCLLVLLLAAPRASGAEAPKAGRYLAVFADGQRIEGSRITGWGQEKASVRLDQTPLLEARRSLRWLRDRSIQPWDPDRGSAVGYVEFVGGDRLIGRVTGVAWARPGRDARLHVHLAEPQSPRSHPWRNPIRISQVGIRRVVWGRRPPRPFAPGTCFLDNGSRLRFLSMRWTNAGLSLLLDDGVRLVPFGEAAELHLRPTDPWETYCRQLAVLSPDCTAALVRIETGSGMILTGSADRIHVISESGRKGRTGYGYMQPAWTSDAVCVPMDTMRTWWHFAPDRVPLTQMAPDRVVQRSMTGYRWRWRRNLSAAGGQLVSGGELAGWGLGVHAHNELVFTLPPFARSFRTRIGLDASAGTGGCARALVYLNSANGKPLYRSDVLVGSAALADTGEIKLPAPGAAPRRLVLVADAAHKDRPAGADPLDIRDTLNWVQPVLHLDRGALRAEVARRVATVTMPALQGWTVPRGLPPVRSQWDQNDRTNPRFFAAVSTAGKGLTLSRRARIGPKQRWLKLHVRQVGKRTVVGCVDVRIDGRTVTRIPVNHGNSDLPYVMSMAPWEGKQVDLQVVYTPGSADEHVQFRALALAPRTTDVRWVPLPTVHAISQNGGGLTGRPDGSIFAAGGRTTVPRQLDTYTVRAVTELPRVTALRVEALPDSALPEAGPGRWGNAKLTQIRVSTLPRRRRALRGRYVRVEMPQAGSALCLSEVEVFAPPPGDEALLADLPKPRPESTAGWPKLSAEAVTAIVRTPPAERTVAQRALLRAYLDTITENIALKRKASQSSTAGKYGADRAVDGKTSWSYTVTEVQDRPWWQVDLGAERRIDRIVVWNHVEIDTVQGLRNFDVVVLDEDGREVWRRRDISDPPVPAVAVFDSDARDISVGRAYESDVSAAHSTVAQALDSSRSGWCVYAPLGRGRAAVFALDKPVDARRTGLRIDLKFAEERWYQSFGRFRLLVTADEPPEIVEPVAVVTGPTGGAIRSHVSGPAATSPYVLFEDDGRFEPLAAKQAPKIALIADDKHAGTRAVRIAPGGACRLTLGRIVPIRTSPGEGEFRYIRFAFRKYGGGKVSLGLEHIDRPQQPCRYQAGPHTPTQRVARSVWPMDLPAEWIVIDRDVYRDFGRLDVTGLTIGCEDGTHVVLDHVYAVRSPGEFKHLPAAPSPQETNTKARLAMVREALKKARAAAVAIDADGMQGAGVLVGSDGWVLTAGHLIAGVGAKVTVRTRDGRVVRAKAAGIDRETDIGLVMITDKGPWKGVKIAPVKSLRTYTMYAGACFTPAHDAGKTPRGYAALVQAYGSGTAWVDVHLPYAAVGGPLLNAEGQVVGVHNDTDREGHLQFSPTHTAVENWDRLARGDLWGTWMRGTGPVMGVYTTERQGNCLVLRVYPNMPAVKAGLRPRDIIQKVEGRPVANYYHIGKILADKDPGDSVTVVVQRGETTFEREMPLVRRRPLPPRPPWRPHK